MEGSPVFTRFWSVSLLMLRVSSSSPCSSGATRVGSSTEPSASVFWLPPRNCLSCIDFPNGRQTWVGSTGFFPSDTLLLNERLAGDREILFRRGGLRIEQIVAGIRPRKIDIRTNLIEDAA